MIFENLICVIRSLSRDIRDSFLKNLTASNELYESVCKLRIFDTKHKYYTAIKAVQ